MDKYDYVITKPEMEEVLYHAGFHKYIDKYLGKNGKWIYKYAGQVKNKIKDIYYREKSKAGARDVKAVRKALRIKDPTIITDGAKRKRYPMFTKYSINKAYYGNSGKSDSRSSQRGSRVNEGIAAGRKRVAKTKQNAKKIKTQDPTKKSVAKYYSKNNGPFPSDWNDLRFKGYSNSMTNAGERGSRVNQGIAAGRKRTKNKKRR